MEKQPIDDLFARKLRGAEATPGADVFGRLQSRMNTTPMPEPKRRLAGWWYGMAAASVLLAVVWISWPKHGGVTSLAKQEMVESSQARQVNQSIEPVQLKNNDHQALESVAVQTSEKAKSAVKRDQPEAVDNQLARLGDVSANKKVAEMPDQQAVAPGSVPNAQPNLELVIAKADVIPQTSAETGRVTAGRTVVMTIAEPEPTRLAVAQPVKAEATPDSPGLNQLLEKVKQIKSGEVFARATPASRPAENRTGIGRFVNGVRESLRNENTLEP